MADLHGCWQATPDAAVPYPGYASTRQQVGRAIPCPPFCYRMLFLWARFA